MAIEKQFGIQILDQKPEKFSTFNDAIRFIEEEIQKH